jgi:hypothetical protein
MTDETDIQKTLQSWADFQKNMWDRWLESLEKGEGASSGTLWAQGLERWKESVDKMLDYQAESVRTWAEGREQIQGGPAETKQWADEGVSIVEGWVSAQRTLWNQWFELIGSTPGSASAAQPMQVGLDQWRDFGEKMLDLQSNWTAAWPRPAETGGGTHKKK